MTPMISTYWYSHQCAWVWARPDMPQIDCDRGLAITSEIRPQIRLSLCDGADYSSLSSLPSHPLSLMESAVMFWAAPWRLTWQGTEGGLQLIASEELRPQSNSPQGTEWFQQPCEHGSESSSSWILSWLWPEYLSSSQPCDLEPKDPSKQHPDSWSIETMRQ